MTLDLATRKKYNRLFAPHESLEPDDARNLDMDTISVEQGNAVRGYRWVTRWTETVGMAESPVCKLFTGLPGSGKTTELKRLQAMLRDPGICNLLPVYIDAFEYLDLTSPIDTIDLLAVILHGAERTLLEAEGKDPEKAMESGYFKRFWDWLNQTDLEMKKLTIPGAGKLVLEMKDRPNLRRMVRQSLSDRFTVFYYEVCDEILNLQTRAQKLGKAGLVIIFDSLEKLQGLSSNWHEVLQSAEQVFRRNKRFLVLPAHILYTVPPALTTHIKDTELEFLPMIKVRDRTGKENRGGIAMAREMVRKRISDEGLSAILGEAERETRIKRIILDSGGYPREILQVLQELLLSESFPVTESAFRRALARFADPYRNIVYTEAHDWLAGVAVTKELNLSDEKHKRIADRMLQEHAVLRYHNEQKWYDPHPAVKSIAGVQEAIQGLKE
ncbi:MAG: hypothetical protein QNK37_03640 [Acidobacteriota bacterium]|nr:hypothetical protein [Acidobacteriota bacterium]